MSKARHFSGFDPQLLKLAGGVAVIPHASDDVALLRAGREGLRIRSPGNDVLELIASLISGTTQDAMEAITSTWRPPTAVAQLVEQLQSQGMMLVAGTTSLSTAELERFDRVLGYCSRYEKEGASRFELFERLRSSHVLLIGAGSLGSWILQQLVPVGIGTIIVVDNDTLETSNLQRQSLYRQSDVGKKKIQAAEEACQRISDFTKVVGVDAYLDSEAAVERVIRHHGPFDLVILTADTPLHHITHWTSEAAKRTNTAVLKGNSRGPGPLYVPNQSACLYCELLSSSQPPANIDALYKTAELRNAIPKQPGVALGWSPAVNAALMAKDAVYYLSGLTQPSTLGAKLLLNETADGMSTQRLAFDPQPNCPVCALADVQC